MTKKTSVSVIAARMTTFNPGMATVDLAFDAFVRRNGLADRIEINRYCIFDLPSFPPFADGTELSYKPMLGHLEEIYNSDAIVYWGDFHHAWNYQQQDLKGHWKLSKHKSEPLTDKIIYDHLLLHSAPESVFPKTISYGTTMMGDNAIDLDISQEYKDALRYFLSSIRNIWMRDVYSAMRVSHLLNDYSNSHLATDCALLFDRSDAERISRLDANRGISGDYIATFFGRSSGKLKPRLISFAVEVAERVNRKIIWLPWLHSLPKDTYRSLNYSRLIGSGIGSKNLTSLTELSALQPRNYSDLIRHLLGSALVITDTYHLSLIAWRMGIPAICVGFGARASQHTLGDKKKETFFSSYNAQPFYVFTENIMNKTTRLQAVDYLEHIILSGTQLASSIHNNICNHSKRAEQALLTSLVNIITSQQ